MVFFSLHRGFVDELVVFIHKMNEPNLATGEPAKWNLNFFQGPLLCFWRPLGTHCLNMAILTLYVCFLALQ